MNTQIDTKTPVNTQFLALEEGRIAYDDAGGQGPLVVLVPGIGDLRSQYRLVAPALVRAGAPVPAMPVPDGS